jgi:hypothetical protein
MNACDPDADIENLRKLIKINAGVDIKLTKKEICQAYQNIQDGKLPLPPLVMNSSRTYLVDKNSPLKPNDYELLFDSTTKRADLKRIARKVNLKNVEQMTKSQIVDAIGKRLRYMKIHEPVKFARKRQVSVIKTTTTAVNNTAVLNVNTNVNRVNTNVNRMNTNVNRVNTNVNRVNTNVNRVNTNVNRVNTNVNRVNTNVNRVNTNKNSKISFPTGGLFVKGQKPKFLDGSAPVEKKTGFFAGLFGKKKNKNFIAANKFKGSKNGYVFRNGEKGLGYYLNTGRIQGPQIPPTDIIQPTPTNEDLSLDFAVARIKQLELKREQKFLNKIQLGSAKRKQIVMEAEQAKEEERQFLKFLEQLNISNTNRNSFRRRMATDDFKQLQVEAQLKADDKANVTRSNEEKMIMFLKTTSLSNVNKNLFLNRARKEGSNVNSLIDEARSLNADIKNQKLTNKQEQFRKILQNYNKLNGTDKEALIASVSETTNVNSMRKMADDLLKKRIEEKQNVVAQNLLSFLTPLQINQSNKNDFLRRFKNEGVNINTIKSEALKLQEAKGSSNIENLRVRLETRLNEISLNQLNKNAILRKFTNGNRNVDKLIEEAKNLKKQRNTEGFNQAQKEYQSYLNTLPGLTNSDKQQLINNGNMNRNRAKSLSNQRVTNTKQSERNGFSQFLTDLGLNNSDKADMMAKYNSETLTVNALQRNAQTLKNKRVTEQKIVNKKTLKEYMNLTNLSNDVKANIEKRFDANQANLKTLQTEINKMVQNTQNAKLANNKAKFTNYVRTTILSQSNQNAFIRKLNANTVNVASLRQEVNAMVSQMVQKQRNKDRDELDEYMKTKGLTNENRKTILNKFNVNNKIVLDNLKQEANAVVTLKIQEKKNANAAELRNYVREFGLSTQEVNTLVAKLNRNSLNSLKTEAERIAKKKYEDKKNANRRNLNVYMNQIGLKSNNKKNILNKNLPLNEGKALANQILQTRIQEKREKNRTKLRLYLNNLNLTNTEKNKYLTNFNKNINVNTIKRNANAYVVQKKVTTKTEQLAALKAFLNEQGLTVDEQKPFVNRLERNLDNVNALKKEASNYVIQRSKKERGMRREELIQYLKTLNLDQLDINQILKQFDNTNTNITVLKGQAKNINNSRKQERRAKDEEEFMNYLNTLENLSANNRAEITSRLNSNFISWSALKKSATNLALKRASDRRKKEEIELTNFMNTLGLNASDKRRLLKNLNNHVKNVGTLKEDARALKKKMNMNRIATQRNQFSKFLGTLYLNNSDRNAFLEQFNDRTTNLNTLQKNAKNKEVKTIQEKKDELSVYISDLGLEATDRNLILKNYNADPRSVNTLRNKARQIKNARNAEKIEELRRELKEYLNTLNLLNNTNKSKILSTNPTINNGKAEGNRIQEFKRVAKKGVNTVTLRNSIKNLSNEDQSYLLNKFETRNVTLDSVLKEASDLRKKRATEKRSRERNDLYNFVNRLDMNVSDRNSIMNKFNKTNATINTLKNEASKLKNRRTSEKRSTNKQSLTNFLSTLNLSGSNKKSILAKFNSNKNATLTSLRTNAEELVRQRGVEKRLANRQELSKYLTKLGLSNTNTAIILNKFNTDKTVTTSDARKEANALLAQRIKEKTAVNRESLVNFMNTLSITNVNKAKILKNFDSEAATLNTLKKRATDINTQIIGKATERQELSNYINELGINGTPLLQKFNNGRSSLKRLKQDALKIRKIANAQSVKTKKDELRVYLKETRLQNTNKQSFLNRIEINTNMNTIKREVRELNDVLKLRNDELAKKKSELSVYLNTLNNLTSNQRIGLIKKVVSANTNIQPLKNEGNSLNKSTKNKREEQKRLEEEKRIKQEVVKKLKDEAKLEKHLRGLKHLTSKEMESYMSTFTNNKSTLEDIIKVSVAKNADNEKDKDMIRNYVRRSVIPQSQKDVYLKQLNTPHVNATPIKSLVNANVTAEKITIQKSIKNAEYKLKTLTNITADERGKFKIRLGSEPVSNILKEAEKLNSNRKSAKAAKNKMTKNVAESLRVLTTLTRNNRKAFMNRLNQNGPQKVISNAVALNSERKNVVRKAESAKKIAEEKRRLEEIAQKRRNIEEARIKGIRNQETKNVAAKLQSLTSLERENRKKFMNRLPTNGPNKVVANATKLNVDRKRTIELEKKLAEDKKRAEEARVKAEEAKKRSQNLQTKRVATRLQSLTSLERENRKKFMNRLPTNGAQKVLANATTLNQERKNTAKKTREGVEWKLKQIGVKGSNLQSLMKRWNDSKNKTIFDEARKKVEEERAKQMAKQPLLNKVVREIPGTFGQWRRGWEDAIRKAGTPEELQRLERLLDQKVSLRKEIEQASISEDKRRGQLRFVMQMRNDVEKRRQELAKDIRAKRDTEDRATRETAQKLQSMNKLGHDNRKRFMNRITRGEDVRKVLTNADKLQRDRTAKQRVEAERKDLEQKQSQERKERERKTREYEKAKQAKLRSNTAKMLQGMSGLERRNRREFMQRLERGEEPSRVISNAQQRVRPTTGPQPLGRIAPRTKKMKAKNRTRAEVLKQQRRRR